MPSGSADDKQFEDLQSRSLQLDGSESCLSPIAEFDELGRKRFLAKYGY
jgi:hypothetical protein